MEGSEGAAIRRPLEAEVSPCPWLFAVPAPRDVAFWAAGRDEALNLCFIAEPNRLRAWPSVHAREAVHPPGWGFEALGSETGPNPGPLPETLAMGAARLVTKDVFENEVLNAKGLSVIDFGASWCGPCQALAPAYDRIAEEFGAKAFIGKVDVDQDADLASRYNVTSVPTIIFLKDGQKVDQVMGNYPEQIRTKIKALL